MAAPRSSTESRHTKVLGRPIGWCERRTSSRPVPPGSPYWKTFELADSTGIVDWDESREPQSAW